MDRVIQALQEGKHALLESPTGTGKTLCLLCATLAWREAENKKRGLKLGPGGEVQELPPIIYASRTHSQLCQVMKEIKKTSYKVKAAILGSRQQQCCNPALSKLQGTARNHACVKMTRAKTCQWYTTVDTEPLDQIHLHASKIMDLEDLDQLAKKKSGPCPYYLARKMAEISDIVFLPYNYLVDKRFRQNMISSFSWDGAVVIFDEAHNIEQSCSEAASFDLPVSVLTNVVFELERAGRLCSKMSLHDLKQEDTLNQKQRNAKRPQASKSWEAVSARALTLINMTKALEKSLTTMQIPRDGKTFPGEHIFKLLSDACITEQNWKVLTDALKDAAELLVDDPGTASGDMQQLSSRLNGGSCSLLADALEKAFDTKASPSSTGPPYHKAYRVHIHDDRLTAGASRLVLSYWCFSPGITMRQLIHDLKVKTVILTSGTLSPMDSFAAELSVPFPIRLENGHVIGKEQALVRCVRVGPTGMPLDSSYKCRGDPKYLADLGHAVVHFLKIIPGGVLMFFPSYIVLQSCLDFWKAAKKGGMSTWGRILKVKTAIVEPQNPAMFQAKIREYQINLRNGRGCVFFAVCRGKVSEGIDFSDDAGRAVILAGIPYAQFTDPKVKLKREFLDQQKSSLNGTKWYCQTAVRAVNQAIGRVIRHKDDYGAILLCDRRFGERNVQSQLSKWVRGFFTQEQSFGKLLLSLTDFFKKDPNVEPDSKADTRTESEAEPKAEPRVDTRSKTEAKAEDTELQFRDANLTSSAVKRTASFTEDCADVKSPKRRKQKSPSPALEEGTPQEKAPCQLIEADVKSKYSSNPKEFLSQLKEELSEKLYSQIKSLLSLFKQERDVDRFQESLISILGTEEALRPLLSHFSLFLPKSHHASFLNKLKALNTDAIPTSAPLSQITSDLSSLSKSTPSHSS